MKELKKLEELMGPRISGSEDIVGWGEWEVWHPVLAEVGRLAKRGRNAVVAIDGRCGSGKTGLARLLESLFLCNVLHMDDFYLPLHLRPENWQERGFVSPLLLCKGGDGRGSTAGTETVDDCGRELFSTSVNGGNL